MEKNNLNCSIKKLYHSFLPLFDSDLECQEWVDEICQKLIHGYTVVVENEEYDNLSLDEFLCRVNNSLNINLEFFVKRYKDALANIPKERADKLTEYIKKTAKTEDIEQEFINE